MKSAISASLVSAVCLLSIGNGVARDKHEDEVVDATLDSIDLCMHWHGEEPYDQKRAQEINKGIKRDCAKAQKSAGRAYRLYPENKDLAGPLIELNEMGFFNISKENLKNLCVNAKPFFREWSKEWKITHPAYWVRCREQAEELENEK